MSNATLKKMMVLVADQDMEYAIGSLLKNRPKSISILQMAEKIDYEIKRHPRRDPGCRGEGVEFVRSYAKTHQNIIMMFDYEGSGCEGKDVEPIENKLEEAFVHSGWKNACVIVIQPELEIWAWSDSPNVDKELGWSGKTPNLRNWLMERKFISQLNEKPKRPKEAFEKALRQVQKPASASIFSELAKSVGLERCQDRSFIKLKNTLKEWFPAKR